jgi:hypothetical protein
MLRTFGTCKKITCLSYVRICGITHILELQSLHDKVLRTTCNFRSHTPVRDLHMAFNLPYVYNYKIENEYDRSIGQGEARHRKYMTLNFEAVKLMTVQVTNLSL